MKLIIMMPARNHPFEFKPSMALSHQLLDGSLMSQGLKCLHSVLRESVVHVKADGLEGLHAISLRLHKR